MQGGRSPVLETAQRSRRRTARLHLNKKPWVLHGTTYASSQGTAQDLGSHCPLSRLMCTLLAAIKISSRCYSCIHAHLHRSCIALGITTMHYILYCTTGTTVNCWRPSYLLSLPRRLLLQRQPSCRCRRMH